MALIGSNIGNIIGTAAPSITVVSVTYVDSFDFEVVFSAAVTAQNAGDANLELQVWSIGPDDYVWMPAFDISQLESNKVQVAIESGNPDIGVSGWRITGELTGVIGVSGTIAFPQSGTIDPGGG